MITQNLLTAALKAAEPIVKDYVRQLKAQISKSDKQIAKLEIEKSKFKNQNITYKQKVSALQKALDKFESEKGGDIHLHINPSTSSSHQSEK
jgi:predicted RNase H-like nuclease (RuvC/YqgF family)